MVDVNWLVIIATTTRTLTTIVIRVSPLVRAGKTNKSIATFAFYRLFNYLCANGANEVSIVFFWQWID